MARLAAYVHVAGQWYAPGDMPPPEVAARITNPKAWEDGVLPDPPDAEADAEPAADNQPGAQEAKPAEPATPAEPAAAAEPAGEKERMQAPPRSGRGSGLDAWQAFAVDHDVEFPDGASRDEIIAACVRAGVIPAE
ncbi:MAG TPA: hypothetical protein VF174_09935 [Micromonosporaceae bacterium]